MSLAPPAVTSNVVAQPCIPDAVRQPSVGPGLREDFVGVLESMLWTVKVGETVVLFLGPAQRETSNKKQKVKRNLLIHLS